MSGNKWMRKLVGVTAVSMTLSMGALCANAQSTTTGNNNAAAPTTPVVTENVTVVTTVEAPAAAPAATADQPGVLGANRTNEAGAVAAVVPGADEPGVLGANRDRSPRTAAGDSGLLLMIANASFAGAGALAYFGKRRA